MIFYYDNGQKRREATYVESKRKGDVEPAYMSGLVTYWSPNGAKRYEKTIDLDHPPEKGVSWPEQWYTNDGSKVAGPPTNEPSIDEFLNVGAWQAGGAASVCNWGTPSELKLSQEYFPKSVFAHPSNKAGKVWSYRCRDGRGVQEFRGLWRGWGSPDGSGFV